MRDDAGNSKAQSLGDLIGALRPGDPCPWCGARLQRGAALRQIGVSILGATAERPEDEAGESTLSCPQCLSEVCGTESGARAGRSALLSAAA
jgi:hypothetical protein